MFEETHQAFTRTFPRNVKLAMSTGNVRFIWYRLWIIRQTLDQVHVDQPQFSQDKPLVPLPKQAVLVRGRSFCLHYFESNHVFCYPANTWLTAKKKMSKIWRFTGQKPVYFSEYMTFLQVAMIFWSSPGGVAVAISCVSRHVYSQVRGVDPVLLREKVYTLFWVAVSVVEIRQRTCSTPFGVMMGFSLAGICSMTVISTAVKDFHRDRITMKHLYVLKL